MNKFFSTTQKLLEKEILASFNKARKLSEHTHVWSKDALQRLDRFATVGKMIRGSLVVLAAEPKTKTELNNAIKIGAMLEIMHSGVLVHDDIMDRDSTRRGLSTIHTQYKHSVNLESASEELHYGESMASCVAIMAYFLAMNKFTEINNRKSLPSLIELFSQEMWMLSAAQMDDIHSSTSRARVGEQSILRIYEQKTGRYTFALPMFAGMILQNKPTRAINRQVFKLAKNLGIIFQLRDDCLGVFGDTKKTGKSVGGDIREKKQTWLYFELLKRCSIAEAKQLRAWYSRNKVLGKSEQAQVGALFQKYQLEALANQEIAKLQKTVITEIHKLPLKLVTKQALLELVEFLAGREK